VAKKAAPASSAAARLSLPSFDTIMALGSF